MRPKSSPAAQHVTMARRKQNFEIELRCGFVVFFFSVSSTIKAQQQEAKARSLSENKVVVPAKKTPSEKEKTPAHRRKKSRGMQQERLSHAASRNKPVFLLLSTLII